MMAISIIKGALAGTSTLELINHDSRPSWKRYGTGYSYFKAWAQRDGSIDITAEEHAKDSRSGKTVMLNLYPDQVDALYEFIRKLKTDGATS